MQHHHNVFQVHIVLELCAHVQRNFIMILVPKLVLQEKLMANRAAPQLNANILFIWVNYITV